MSESTAATQDTAWWRALDWAALRSVAVISASILVIAASYGVTAQSAGFAWWQLTLLATVVLAGASEFVFVGVIAVGGSPLLGALAGAVVNTRNFGYGLALGRTVGSGPSLLVGAHLINDETAALATAERDPAKARALFLACGIGVLACWPIGAAIGAGLGQVITDPNALGLDAALPALLAALAIPALRGRQIWAAVVVGATIALASTPWLPAGMPVIAALVGFAAVEAVARALPSTQTRSTPAAARESTVVPQEMRR